MTTIEIKELRKEVKQYIDHADGRMLRVIYAMLEADELEDRWNKISEGERASIEEGLKQIKAGKTVPHEEVMKKI